MRRTSVAGIEMISWDPASKCGVGIRLLASMLSSQGLSAESKRVNGLELCLLRFLPPSVTLLEASDRECDLRSESSSLHWWDSVWDENQDWPLSTIYTLYTHIPTLLNYIFPFHQNSRQIPLKLASGSILWTLHKIQYIDIQ